MMQYELAGGGPPAHRTAAAAVPSSGARAAVTSARTPGTAAGATALAAAWRQVRRRLVDRHGVWPVHQLLPRPVPISLELPVLLPPTPRAGCAPATAVRCATRALAVPASPDVTGAVGDDGVLVLLVASDGIYWQRLRWARGAAASGAAADTLRAAVKMQPKLRYVCAPRQLLALRLCVARAT